MYNYILSGFWIFRRYECPLKNQIVTHDYVDWDKLPALISGVDITWHRLWILSLITGNLEIKWIEAALVRKYQQLQK